MKEVVMRKVKLALACAAFMLMPIALPTGGASAKEQTDTVSLIEQSVETIEDDSVETVINLTDGTSNELDNAVLAVSLEEVCAAAPMADEIESYEVLYENQSILLVEPLGFPGFKTEKEGYKYYSATFMIPGTNKEVFLTGLTAASIDTICDELIANYSKGEDFVIEGLDIIDAEKLYRDKAGDDNLCWAASASNMLTYTGWGQVAGFENEDQLFQVFADNFIDNGFSQDSGIYWFFTGSTLREDGNKGRLKKYPGSGAYLKGYSYSDYCANVTITGSAWSYEMSNMFEKLKAGYGIGLGITWLGSGSDSGHAITLWGVITNKDYSPSQKEYWDTLIVTDSDTDRPPVEHYNRQLQQNTFEVYKLTPYKSEEGDDEENDSFKFYENDSALLAGYFYLQPYTEDLKPETDDKATLDFQNTCDLLISDVATSNNAENAVTSEYECFAGNVYLFPEVANGGDVDFSGEIEFDVVVKDSKGNEVSSVSESKAITLKALTSDDKHSIAVGELAPGKYTYEITVNPKHTIPEAMYINNSFSGSFEVLDVKSVLSDMAIKCSVGEETEFGEYPIEFSYTGVEDSWLIKNGDSISLKVSFYKDGKWGDYSDKEIRFSEDEDNDDLYRSILLSKGGEKARIAFQITKKSVTYCIVSDEIVFPYTGLEVVATENNIGKNSTVLDSAATTLNDGEYFAFKIVNKTNTDIPEITGTYRLKAVSKFDEETILVDSTEITLKKGEETEEILVNDIKNKGSISGSFIVMAEVSFSCGDESTTNYLELGSFCAKEQASAHVDTNNDVVDPYDDKISLREAISYAEENPGTTITFDPVADDLTLESPLVVNGSVTVNGRIELGIGYKFVRISGGNKNRLITVEKDGRLTLMDIRLESGKDDKSGGAVQVNGGVLLMMNCTVNDTSATDKGGAICVDDGYLLLKNTCIVGTSSGFGGAIFMTAGSEGEMLNCFITDVTSNVGTIYNNNGKLNVINSVIAKNKAAGFSKKNTAIRGSSDTNIINSIIGNGNDDDFMGRLNIFASTVSSDPTLVTYDDYCVLSPVDKMFNLDKNKDIVDYSESKDACILLPNMRRGGSSGVETSVSDGVIYVSKDGKNKVNTGVATLFSDAELHLDMTGALRNGVAGCYATQVPNMEDLDIEKIAPVVYTAGKEIKPVITIKDGKKKLVEGVDYMTVNMGNPQIGNNAVIVMGMGGYYGAATLEYKVVNVSVRYRAYVQKKGWMSFVKDGAMAGAKENLRMETIQMKLSGNSDISGGIKYRAYVQKLGWTFWADTALSDSYAGTKGKSLRIESVQIKAYGDLASAYDVYYRVYCDKYGWLDWAKNGASAGTSGLAKKLQAFQVKLVVKGGKAPGKTTKPYATNKNP